jgi:predicted RNA binding protein YcfA (HicA-like mRNA interferase family)
MILRHPTKEGSVIVPIHSGRDIPVGTLASIVDDAGLTADDVRRLL